APDDELPSVSSSKELAGAETVTAAAEDDDGAILAADTDDELIAKIEDELLGDADDELIAKADDRDGLLLASARSIEGTDTGARTTWEDPAADLERGGSESLILQSGVETSEGGTALGGTADQRPLAPDQVPSDNLASTSPGGSAGTGEDADRESGGG